MREVMNFMRLNPSVNPFPPPNSWMDPSQQLKKTLFGVGIKMLSSLEYAFPNAIWVPIGRKAVDVGDFLDAFYLSEGLSDRVIRLDFSDRMNPNQFNLLELFKNLNLVDPEGLPLHKFVLLDRTQFYPWSRSRVLLSYIYYQLPVHMVRPYLSFINTVDLSNNHRKISSLVDWEKWWKDVLIGPFGPREILSVTGKTIFSGNWHRDFQNLVRTTEGKLKSFPGKLSSIRERKRILWSMAEIAIVVKTPEFRSQLQEFASKAFGVDFFDGLNHSPILPEGVMQYPPGG